MRRRPEGARRAHEVAVLLNTDGQPSVFLVGQRSANGNRQACTYSAGTAAAQGPIELVCVPQTAATAGDAGPVLIFDDFPHFSLEPGYADRRGIPSVSRRLTSLLH